MKKKTINWLMIIGGLILVAVGIFIIKTHPDVDGIMRTLPYICIGVGCGVFGHGLGNWLADKAAAKAPDDAKRIEIETKDERNVMIANQAKAKAYDSMVFIFGDLMIVLALLNIDMVVVLMLVSCYLLVVGISIYYRIKYEKEM